MFSIPMIAQHNPSGFRPDEIWFGYLAGMIVAAYVAYRSIKAYREGRSERVKSRKPSDGHRLELD
jgi:hypothetical protein